jgi:catechol 2,3-dioxygenase-like lactoylglutathione lyase family enzyme
MPGPSGSHGKRSLATVTLVVADYDEAVAWYTEKLGFALESNIDLGGGKRWVTVLAGEGSRLLLARRKEKPSLPRSATRQAARRFLSETDDFTRPRGDARQGRPFQGTAAP